jgi:Zn-dependent protease with chaperone function
MTAPAGPVAAADDAPAVRPDVLAYPSPTTTRFLILVAALLTAGLFVGTWVHNGSTAGDAWARSVATCSQLLAPPVAVGGNPAAVFDAQEAYNDCIAPAERTRAAFSFGGAFVAAVGGALVLFVSPIVVERRRRLHAPGPRLDSAAQRFRELATAAQLPRPPRLVIGSTTQRDAFSYGSPGHYRISLPPALAVRWRDAARFDPVVRHELAHVAHRDVALAWLTRAIWYAVVPLLVLPVLLALARADFSLLPDYAWRALLFAAVVLLVSPATLRSREHDADLRAARFAGDEATLSAVLRSARALPATGLRRLLAYHPQPARRVEVLDRPGRAATVTFVDGLAAAYLAALSSPLLVSVISAVLTGTGQLALAEVAADLLVGPLIGATVGLGLWRQILVNRVVRGPRVNVAPVAVGVFSGLILGQVMSFANTGIGVLGGLGNPMWLLVTGILAMGATAVMAGLGELWADAAPRLPSAKASWLLAVVLGGVLFAAVLWAAATLQNALDWGGWTLAGAVLVTILGTAPPAVAALILAVGAGAALIMTPRPGSLAPAWLIESGSPPPWPSATRTTRRLVVGTGVAAGLGGAATIALYRAAAGAAADLAEQEARFYAYLWVAASVGAVASLVLSSAMPARGPGAALVAAPLASLIAASGFVLLNTVLGGALITSFLATVVERVLGLGLLLSVLVAVVALAAPRLGSVVAGVARPELVLAPAALLCAVAVSGTLIAARASVVPAITAGSTGSSPAQTPAEGASESTYLATVVPEITTRYSQAESALRSIAASSGDGGAIAHQIRTEVIEPVRVLLQEARSWRFEDADVRRVHEQSVTALELAVRAFTDYADAHDRGDTELLEQAIQVRAQEGAAWQQWQAGVAQLEEAAHEE